MYDSQTTGSRANGAGSIPGADYPFTAHPGGGVAVQNPVFPPYGGVHGDAVHSAYPGPLPSVAAPIVALHPQSQTVQQQQQRQSQQAPPWDQVPSQQVIGSGTSVPVPRVVQQGGGLSLACPSPFGPTPGLKPIPPISALPSPTSTQCFNSQNMSYLNDSDGADGRNAFPLTFHDSDHSPRLGSLSITNTFPNPLGSDNEPFDNMNMNTAGSPRPNRCPMMKLLNLNNADMTNMTCPMRGLFHNSPASGMTGVSGVAAASGGSRPPRPRTVNVPPHHPFSALLPGDIGGGGNGNNGGTLPPALGPNGCASGSASSTVSRRALPAPIEKGHNPETIEEDEAGEYDEDIDLQRDASRDGGGPNLNRKRRKTVCYTNRQREGNHRSKARKRALAEFVSGNNDDELYPEDESVGEEEDDEKYPEVGVRATATIQVEKDVFEGHHSMHRNLARQMVLEGLRHIAEHRWIHEKYDIDGEAVRYLVFLDEDLKIPLEFEETKPKRGRPPKHKKARTNENGKDMKEYNEDPEHDKLYRLNFQIIFEREVEEEVRSEIVQNMKIDLNQTSLSMLLSRVLSVRIDITERVQAYSLYAVEAGKLKEYEKYETEEEARKKKKREREQKRRENKKKEMRKGQAS